MLHRVGLFFFFLIMLANVSLFAYQYQTFSTDVFMDSDGDGVEDSLDDYPFDSTRAFNKNISISESNNEHENIDCSIDIVKDSNNHVRYVYADFFVSKFALGSSFELKFDNIAFNDIQDMRFLRTNDASHVRSSCKSSDVKPLILRVEVGSNDNRVSGLEEVAGKYSLYMELKEGSRLDNQPFVVREDVEFPPYYGFSSLER